MWCVFFLDSENCQFILKKVFFFPVLLLGNYWKIHSEELEGHIISERQSVQSAGVQSFHWLERLKLNGGCDRFHHTWCQKWD